ncbi:RDD family protein [Schumannella luteola]|uniref:Putative RDD family membrane protein YckC n=1 Tax=Schumannella luteola TaxID=472059 RepID=A0A852YG34_9MICO|nr:RDD family protein [Schumannella luteola]NYG98757.1 putative RDD family membrane protein YckC [Schumannella luteola]TPX04441.1 RDD family protein [Schumannella luteola]
MARTPEADSIDYDDTVDELIVGEAVALDLRPASFAVRAGGCAIDALVYGGGYVGTIIALSFSGLFDQIGEAEAAILSVVLLVSCLIVAPIVVELASRGKSLGRLALGTRIVRDDGGAIGFRHAFIRSIVGLVDFWFTSFGAAALTGLLNRRSKRLGDLLAGTYAQYERVSKAQKPVFGVPFQLSGWAQTADVGRLPSPLARRIAQFLAQAPKMTPDRRVLLARSLADEAAVWVSPIPVGADAELFLAAVTVLRRDREATALQLEAAGLQRLQPALRGTPHGFPDRG